MLSGMMEPKKQQVKEIMEYKKGPLGMVICSKSLKCWHLQMKLSSIKIWFHYAAKEKGLYQHAA